MRPGIALDLDPLAASCGMMPPFGVHAAGIIAGIHEIIPCVRRSVALRAHNCGITVAGELNLGAVTAPGASNHQHGFSCMVLMGLGKCAGAALIDHMSGSEALKRKCGIQRMRRIVGNGMGETPAGARCRLETAIAPAAI